MHIRNPIEWGLDQFRFAAMEIGSVGRGLDRPLETAATSRPAVRRIGLGQVLDALRAGIRDFQARRTDVAFLCVMYPVIGLVLGHLAARQAMLPLLFPLASGFALVGPFAAVGLYEMSRRREQGSDGGWRDAFGVLRSPALGRILLLGLLLAEIFVLWLLAADAIFRATLGPTPPATMTAFLSDVFNTPAGWAMIVYGIGAGFLFAVVALCVSVVSFPMLLDRDVGLATAVDASIRAVAKNPGPMAAWGLIVAAALVLGSIPLFVGLIVVLPVLGHATWHLYRRLVAAG